MAAPINPIGAGVASTPPVNPAPTGRRGILLLVMFCALGVVVAASSVAVWLFLAPSGRAEAVSRGPAYVFRVGTIVVNVAETNGRRYLRTTVELAAPSSKDMRRLEEHRTPLVDAAIGVLGATPLESLLDHSKRETLKAQMRDRLNEAVGGSAVNQVFFTEFVIQ
jgi:flagellar basal body-associated protein FliL